MNELTRRYDIDWLRVISIGLLLFYHVGIAFQPWGMLIGFITNEQSWQSLWFPMAMLNVWRIPFLFFVSGMGVFFALRKRTWKELIIERTRRILIPLMFGIFIIVPIHIFIFQTYYQTETRYTYDVGHLWFLANIFIYVLGLSPIFFYLKRHENERMITTIKKIIAGPTGIFIVITSLTLEAWIVDPHPYELYARTWHGFFLGLIAFFFGFCFVLTGDSFFNFIQRWRWAFLSIAVALFGFRIYQFQFQAPPCLLAIESGFWIFSVLSFGTKYLNRPGAVLNYLSKAAYPVYILHMIFLYLGASLIFQLGLNPVIKFFLLVGFTFSGCFFVYELLIRRIRYLKPLFGLIMNEK